MLHVMCMCAECCILSVRACATRCAIAPVLLCGGHILKRSPGMGCLWESKHLSAFRGLGFFWV